MYSISKIAQEFELSRSALLYYDSIGLLKPSSRSQSGYRQYSREDKNKLQQICAYRQMGLSIKEIQKLIDLSKNESASILEAHLLKLSEQIQSLRKQQYTIVNMLQNDELLKSAGIIDKDAWVEVLRSSGMSDDDMNKWHEEFEKISPQAHHDFLVSLGISNHRIKEIRARRIE